MILRMIGNCDIEYNECFVPDHNKFANADDFHKGVNKTLISSRIHITYLGLGMIAGAFEAAYNYAMNRVQFGKPIAGF
jgi:glutaryl-CoA dehydrogenase